MTSKAADDAKELEIMKCQLMSILPGLRDLESSALSFVELLKYVFVYILFECVHQEMGHHAVYRTVLPPHINKEKLWECFPLVLRQMIGREQFTNVRHVEVSM